jgi:lysozyme
MMKNQLRTLLEDDEGLKNEVYNDHLGKATCGIGHLITRDDPEFGLCVGDPVSEERVTELFNEDVQTAIDDALNLQPELESWPVEAQITFVSLAFQLGGPRLRLFVKMNAALENQHWMTAAIQLRDSRLYRQTPERTERHAKRLEGILS